MTAKKYLVKLTPKDNFFFGGEKTFNTEKGSNYLVKSNYFPQQTGVLGLIRHQLLIQNDCMPLNRNRDEAVELIGKYSFRVQDEPLDFGVIENISPLFIAGDENEYWFPANKEYQWIKEEKEFSFREISNDSYKGTAFTGLWNENGRQVKDFIPEIRDYDPKTGFPDLLINRKGDLKQYDFEEEKESQPQNGIFVPQQQVGIRKDYKGDTKDEAYYIQTFYRLKKGYGFAFILELKDQYAFKQAEKQTILKDALVTFGGEQSMFDMAVEEVPNELQWPEYEDSANSSKIVLKSDAYVPEDILNHCAFAITESKDFRFLETATERTENWYSIAKNSKNKASKVSGKHITRSSKFNLLKKGSVLYANDNILNEIKNKLNNHNFQKIGYNHYKTIKSKS